MNIQNKLLTEQLTDAHFELLLQLMDRIHDAAVMGEMAYHSALHVNEVKGWLDDIIFTAQEAVRELEDSAAHEYSRN